MQKPLVLCVDDEPNILELLVFNLEAAGYEAAAATTGQEALASANTARLMLLDLTLQDMSGHEVLKALRANPATANLPVIVLTASDAEAEAVACFEAGADDYMTKPFSVRELLARVKAVLRRTVETSGEPLICVGPLTIDSGYSEAYRNGV